MARQSLVGFKLFYFVIFVSFTTHHFLNLYFRQIGLSGVQIGTIKAASCIVMVFSQPVWGCLSDLWKMRKGLLSLLLLAAGLIFILVPLKTEFTWICLMIMVYGFFKNPIVPVADSIVMLEVHGDGSRYSQVRLWGAVGLSASVVLMGYYFNATSLRALFWVYLIFTVLALCVSLFLPYERSQFESRQLHLRDFLRLIQSPDFVTFQVAIFFLQTGAFMIDGFFGLYVQERIGNEVTLGWALTLAGGSEIIVYHYLGRLKSVFTARKLLIISAVVSAVRWFLYGQSTMVIQVFMLQLLHGVTFGFFYISAVTYVNEILPKEFATSGQTLLWANAFGIAAVFGSVFGGLLYDVWTYEWLFTVAGLLSAISGLLFVLIPQRQRFC